MKKRHFLKTVKAKMAFVAVFTVVVLGLVMLVIARSTNRNYKSLQTAQCQYMVDAESQRVESVIASLEENAAALALMGQMLYGAGDGGEKTEEQGRLAVMQNFAEGHAVGGGIWYEPYAVDKKRERMCFYAFQDEAGVHFDEEFEALSYHYPSQKWYRTIKNGALEGEAAVWTPPYYDETGTYALMTTVGSGIFSRGRLVGLSTVDWELDAIAESVAEIRPTQHSYAIFADTTTDTILAYTGEDVSFEDTPLSAISWLSDAMEDGRALLNEEEYLVFSNKLSNGMLIVSLVPQKELFANIRQAQLATVLVLLATGVVIVASILLMLHWFVTRPIAALSKTAEEIGGGNLDAEIEVKSSDEFGSLAETFAQMTADLKTHIENLSTVTAEKERIGAELNVATKIQTSMLPCIFPAFPDIKEFDIYASMNAAKEVGGDFYDFFLIDSGHLAVVMADVSGKGVPAALFMVIAKTLLKNHAQNGESPAEIFYNVNNRLCENNDANMFVTAFMGIYEIETCKFTYVNAGHNLPVFAKGGEGYKWLSHNPDFVLAGMEGLEYEQHEITLCKGDRLLLYTDGVTEAMNVNGELFSDPRLLDFLNSEAVHSKTACETLGALLEEIYAFSSGAEQSDDITMLMLEIKNSAETADDAQNGQNAQKDL